ncbi:MAG: hypothetical protein F6K40_05165 [Okeania sp. SIO3I5]|uniref:hypothetical protein n=1 Tax=Okeania sp. SIO3I5 TaxID=2607805 RepID=UPI0013BDC2E2|nr:hypothetical protein [Okeania sp. SIO3I5]NEQ35712.1 hypothetical protein [Okeania sp. SIO3I5]
MKIEPLIYPGEEKAKLDYEKAWSKFLREYEKWGNAATFSVDSGILERKKFLEIHNSGSELLVLLNPEKRPLFLHLFFYMMVAITPLTCLYFLWIDGMAPVYKKTIVKEYLVS